MRTLIILAHAGRAVWNRYRRAVADLGCEADWVHISHHGYSNVYRQLARDVSSGGRVLPGLLRRYPAPRPLEHYTGPGGGGLVLASYSAGYGLSTSILASPADAALVDGVVSIDSWHAGLDPDKTASDGDLAPLLAYAHRARGGEVSCWLGHTDTPTTGYASTTQVAEEVLRLTGPTIEPSPGFVDVAGADIPCTWREVAGLRVEGYNLIGSGWQHATTEHSWALTRWGHDLLARAVQQVQQRRAAVGPSEPFPSPDGSDVPLGEEALSVARGEQQAGVREVGGRHSPRIAQYFVGCVRDGRIIRGPVPKTWPWCAAGLSYCLGEASRPGEQLPHRRRIAVRELWADAMASGCARTAAAIRRGDYVPQPGDAWIGVRGGSAAGPDAAPFAPTQGRGHTGRIVSFDGDTLHTLDANINDTWTDCRRPLSSPEMVGVIAYPRPEQTLWAPSAADVAVLRRLWGLSDDAAAGLDGMDAFEDWRAGLDSVEGVVIG